VLVELSPFFWCDLLSPEVAQIVGVAWVLRLAVVDIVSVAHQKLLLERLWVDQRIKMRHFIVFEAFKRIKLTRSPTKEVFSCLLGRIHAKLIFKLTLNQVKSWWFRALISWYFVKIFLGSRNNGKFVLYHSIKFPKNLMDSASEVFLVVDFEPFVDNGGYLGL
jgi:hypothetical protein